jgi:Uma2 family endonuclease
MVATKLLTVEDLERMGNDARHTELVDGVLIKMSPSSWDHGAITAELTGRLWTFVHEHRLGRLFAAETGFVVAREPDSVLGPDIAFVSTTRLPEVKQGRSFSPIAPDLAVEVESPSNTQREIARKMELYLASGTRLIWLFKPKKRVVLVYRPDVPEAMLSESDDLDGFDVLPGFQLRIRDLFELLESQE